jgi:hypothetical protein
MDAKLDESPVNFGKVGIVCTFCHAFLQHENFCAINLLLIYYSCSSLKFHGWKLTIRFTSNYRKTGKSVYELKVTV